MSEPTGWQPDYIAPAAPAPAASPGTPHDGLLQFGDEYLLWDGTEGVLLESKGAILRPRDNDPQLRRLAFPPGFDPARPANGNVAGYAPVAKRMEVSYKERMASGGAYTAQDLSWYVPAAVLDPGWLFKPGDVVIDADNVRWTVLEAGRDAHRSTWFLTCRDLALSYSLTQRITVERPAVHYDDAGVVVKAWPTGPEPRGGFVLYDLRASVHPVRDEVNESRGIAGFQTVYEVVVERDLSITYEDRVRLATGEYLDVVGYEDAQRIDELPKIRGEKRV